jgi:3-hydroxyisobutyrate dehydrogenase
VSDSIEEAAEGASAPVTLLADADAVLDAAGTALGASLDGEAIWIQMSTIGESGTDRCVELARKHGCAFVDAPVLGTKQPAEEGKLVVMASGPTELRDRAAPIFDAIAQRTMWVGEAGAGSRLKVATNSWLLAIVEGAAETLALAEGLGLDPQLVLDAVEPASTPSAASTATLRVAALPGCVAIESAAELRPWLGSASDGAGSPSQPAT